MKIRLAAALLASMIATGASAQSIDQRHVAQHERIAQGVRSGALTPGETRGIVRQQRSIRRQEARMRARSGGTLTPRQRAILRRRENNASRHIYRAKHNGLTR